jgi:hypothetical protein
MFLNLKMSTDSLILYKYPNLMKKKSTAAFDATGETTDGYERADAIINYQLRINIITQYKKNHILGSCLIDDIINFGWVRWEYNRPPDMVRVEEIVKYIENEYSIDWVFNFIYLDSSSITTKDASSITTKDASSKITKCASSKITKGASLEIYDGIHRMTAISEYIKQFEDQQNIRCPLRDTIVIISIKINPTPGEVHDAFIFINKSVPVSKLYLEDRARRDVVEIVVKKWQDKYKNHFKSTSRTYIPNINRDTFMDIVGELYDHYDISGDKKKLGKLLNKINEYMSSIDVLPTTPPISEKALNKCKETGCYIFLVKSTLLFDYIKHHEISI